TVSSHQPRLFCLITPGRPAGSADCSNHFDASIAGKTYRNLNDLGCERIIGAGRPRTNYFLRAATGRSDRPGFRPVGFVTPLPRPPSHGGTGVATADRGQSV